ncbi:MAG: hypothetical protein PUK59_08230, partial [Actinomycetaceae bacterium]|nr:hypothetical protein [Actinomycetaceae bacterium]MDY5854760.1 hypothetical protein [Arcanobacterium sp.]
GAGQSGIERPGVGGSGAGVSGGVGQDRESDNGTSVVGVQRMPDTGSVAGVTALVALLLLGVGAIATRAIATRGTAMRRKDA